MIEFTYQNVSRFRVYWHFLQPLDLFRRLVELTHRQTAEITAEILPSIFITHAHYQAPLYKIILQCVIVFRCLEFILYQKKHYPIFFDQ